MFAVLVVGVGAVAIAVAADVAVLGFLHGSFLVFVCVCCCVARDVQISYVVRVF